MTGSADLNTADFYDYNLPESSIAQEPLADRAAARLGAQRAQRPVAPGAASDQPGRAAILPAGSKGRNRAAHPQRLAQLLMDIVADRVAQGDAKTIAAHTIDFDDGKIQDSTDQQAPVGTVVATTS